jgi:protein-disulfide isomerase
LNVRHRIAFSRPPRFRIAGFLSAAVAQSAIAAAVAKPVSLPDIAIGSAKAPITLTEYSSMSCPHCAAFGQNVFPMLAVEIYRYRQGAFRVP